MVPPEVHKMDEYVCTHKEASTAVFALIYSIFSCSSLCCAPVSEYFAQLQPVSWNASALAVWAVMILRVKRKDGIVSFADLGNLVTIVSLPVEVTCTSVNLHHRICSLEWWWSLLQPTRQARQNNVSYLFSFISTHWIMGWKWVFDPSPMPLSMDACFGSFLPHSICHSSKYRCFPLI